MTITPAIVFCAALTSHVDVMGKTATEIACQNSEIILEASEKHDIDPYLLTSLIYVESNWHTNAVSTSNACGLTQVIPTYSKFNCEELKVPKNGIMEGARILGKLTHKFSKGNVDLALCSYNVGPRCSVKKPVERGLTYARKVIRIMTALKPKGET